MLFPHKAENHSHTKLTVSEHTPLGKYKTPGKSQRSDTCEVEILYPKDFRFLNRDILIETNR